MLQVYKNNCYLYSIVVLEKSFCKVTVALMLLSPTFAIRAKKRLFLGINRRETHDIKGMRLKKWLVVPTYPIDATDKTCKNVFMFLREKSRKKDGKTHRSPSS